MFFTMIVGLNIKYGLIVQSRQKDLKKTLDKIQTRMRLHNRRDVTLSISSHVGNPTHHASAHTRYKQDQVDIFQRNVFRGTTVYQETPERHNGKKYDFERTFQYLLSTKQEWSGYYIRSISLKNIIWFTDRFKTSQGIGAGVFGPVTNILF